MSKEESHANKYGDHFKGEKAHHSLTFYYYLVLAHST
jgi:hypothetical protein